MNVAVFHGNTPSGLAALQARLAQDLEWLTLPNPPWLPETWREGERVRDVAIIGAGMAGLALGTALHHLGIDAPLYDLAPEGQEGPWVTTARMETLRSPKQLTGPALGLPALTFRAWFEAQFGLAAWEALDKIDRVQWMDYLRWYRRVSGVTVHNEHRVTDIRPTADGLVALDMDTPSGARTVWARRVVLATGRDGLGGPLLPDVVQRLPRERWVHSSDVFDYDRLKGLRVGVVGGGASAMDSAATALEAGCARLDLLIRRADLPRINKGKGGGNPGFVHGFLDLPEAWKWRIRHYINAQQVPPPHGSTLRVSRHPNAFFQLGCGLDEVRMAPTGVRVRTAKGEFEFDFLIFATGFGVDWCQRPFLARLAPHVRLWGDRWQAAPGEADAELDASPDLGRLFEFQEKTPGALPGLDRVHCFCYPAVLTHGTVSGDIPAISDGAARLAQGLVSAFYREDIEYHYQRMQAYAEPELFGDEWTAADGPPPLTHEGARA